MSMVSMCVALLVDLCALGRVVQVYKHKWPLAQNPLSGKTKGGPPHTPPITIETGSA